MEQAFGTGRSISITGCQVCGSNILTPILFLGYLPPVDAVERMDGLQERKRYPCQILYCSKCHLVQIGTIIDAQVLFPSEYPYTSSTTKNIRENFAELYQECTSIIPLCADDLAVDIGSNDGNLLSNFQGRHRVLGITPERIGEIAIARGIPTIIDFFAENTVSRIKEEYGKAKVITATNVFAHMEDINGKMRLVLELLADNGIFIMECDYLPRILEMLQYDTMHHEHLLYYSLHSFTHLLQQHGMEAIHAKEIPTHGGSFRVYAARTGKYPVQKSVSRMLQAEQGVVDNTEALLRFAGQVALSKLRLHALLLDIKKAGKRICGIGMPGRAVTLVNYTGINEQILDYVVEIKGSQKIGNYLPGTIIPVVEESRMFAEQPEYALILSWHIAEELIPKIRAKGFLGRFIVPLPEPRIA